MQQSSLFYSKQKETVSNAFARKEVKSDNTTGFTELNKLIEAQVQDEKSETKQKNSNSVQGLENNALVQGTRESEQFKNEKLPKDKPPGLGYTENPTEEVHQKFMKQKSSTLGQESESNKLFYENRGGEQIKNEKLPKNKPPGLGYTENATDEVREKSQKIEISNPETQFNFHQGMNYTNFFNFSAQPVEKTNIQNNNENLEKIESKDPSLNKDSYKIKSKKEIDAEKKIVKEAENKKKKIVEKPTPILKNEEISGKNRNSIHREKEQNSKSSENDQSTKSSIEEGKYEEASVKKLENLSEKPAIIRNELLNQEKVSSREICKPKVLKGNIFGPFMSNTTEIIPQPSPIIDIPMPDKVENISKTTSKKKDKSKPSIESNNPPNKNIESKVSEVSIKLENSNNEAPKLDNLPHKVIAIEVIRKEDEDQSNIEKKSENLVSKAQKRKQIKQKKKLEAQEERKKQETPKGEHSSKSEFIESSEPNQKFNQETGVNQLNKMSDITKKKKNKKKKKSEIIITRRKSDPQMDDNLPLNSINEVEEDEDPIEILDIRDAI